MNLNKHGQLIGTVLGYEFITLYCHIVFYLTVVNVLWLILKHKEAVTCPDYKKYLKVYDL